MQATSYTIEGKKAGSIDLPADVFAAPVKKTLLWEAVKAQLASKRRGTACTKRRDEVSGTGAKPFKQKGGGRARQGSLRAPHFVGGGVVMGPKPRDFSYNIPKSARRSALRSALSSKAKFGNVVVLDKDMDAVKTKTAYNFIQGLANNVEGLKIGNRKRVLFVTNDNNIALSVRNIDGSKSLPAKAINVKDILDHAAIVITNGDALNAVVAKARGEQTEG